MKLLFRGSRDGMTLEAFHDKCDNQGPTLSLFRNEKGYIFGGYASISWTNSGENKNAPESFLFSLTNIYNSQPTKFPSKNEGKEVYHGNFGPVFGECGEDLCTYSDLSKGVYSNFPKSFDDVLRKGKSIFTGSENNDESFNVNEIEIFKLS